MKASVFVEVMYDSLTKNLATKENLKEAEARFR